MLFQVVILWFWIHIVGGTAPSTFNNADTTLHLCTKVTSGRFKDLDLKSITFYNHHQLVIFESDFKYFIPTSEVSKTDMKIPETFLRWNDTELESPSSKIDFSNNETLKSVYMFKQARQQKVFITSNKFRYALHKDKLSFPDMYHTKLVEKVALQSSDPNYSIAHDQGKVDSWGYVLQKDLYQNTSNFVIYQLWVEGWEMKLQGPTQKYHHQYHLERTNISSRAVLVHSSKYDPSKPNYTKPNTRNQLFTSLPRGFILHDQLYLFDPDLGCVFILKGWQRPDLAQLHQNSEDNIIKERVNVPYERFFKCSPEKFPLSEKFPHNVNRCETNNNKLAKIVEIGNSIWYFVFKYSIGFVVILIIFLIFWHILECPWCPTEIFSFRRGKPSAVAPVKKKKKDKKKNNKKSKTPTHTYSGMKVGSSPSSGAPSTSFVSGAAPPPLTSQKSTSLDVTLSSLMGSSSPSKSGGSKSGSKSAVVPQVKSDSSLSGSKSIIDKSIEDGGSTIDGVNSSQMEDFPREPNKSGDSIG